MATFGPYTIRINEYCTYTITANYTLTSTNTITILSVSSLSVTRSGGHDGYKIGIEVDVAEGCDRSSNLFEYTVAYNTTTINCNCYWEWDRPHSGATKHFRLHVFGLGSGTNYLNDSSKAFAVPARPSYAVTYSANGGSGSTASQTKWAGENLALRANGFSRSGFSFVRWNTNASDTGTGYAPGATYTGNAALALHAIWSRTVSYDTNGGGAAPASQSAVATSAIALAGAQAREGFSFREWNTRADGTGTAYPAGGSYPANQPTATLCAIWNRTVAYDANGGAGAPASQVGISTSALTLATAVPARTGWSFDGWNTEADGSGTAYQAGGTYPSGAPDVTLYAQWLRHVDAVSIGDARAYRVAARYPTASTPESDEGEYAFVTVPFRVSGAAGASVALTASALRLADGTATPITPTIVSGSATKPESGEDCGGTLTARVSAALDTEATYLLDVTVTAANTSAGQDAVSATRTVTVATAFFTVDYRAGGHGESHGAPATGEWFNVSYPHRHYQQPDLPVVTFSSRAVAEAALDARPEMMPCVALCLDDWSLWHCEESASQ